MLIGKARAGSEGRMLMNLFIITFHYWIFSSLLIFNRSDSGIVSEWFFLIHYSIQQMNHRKGKEKMTTARGYGYRVASSPLEGEGRGGGEGQV